MYCRIDETLLNIPIRGRVIFADWVLNVDGLRVFLVIESYSLISRLCSHPRSKRPRSFFFKMCLHPEKIPQNVSEFFADSVPKILAYYPNILQRATGFYF